MLSTWSSFDRLLVVAPLTLSQIMPEKVVNFQHFIARTLRGKYITENSFIEIFAKLPEVQESILTGEDKCGVKRAYFEFLDPLVDYMMQKSEFAHDQEWVQEAL